MLRIPTTRLNDNAILPTRGSATAIGIDLYQPKDKWDTLLPGASILLKTGISMSIPLTHYGRIAPRSGLAFKHQIDVLGGVIDSDYRGDIGVILINHGPTEFDINAQTKIAQIIFEKAALAEIYEVDSLGSTERGTGGFGSTGE
jgi:dUTP pyrophosphatase